MPRETVTQAKIAEHVQRLGELHPPIDLDSVDYTVRDPRAVRERYGHVLEYLSRVELEVDRNVLELLVLLPDVDDTNRTFYADVWQPQELHHGLALDRLQQDLGLPPAEPDLELSARMRLLGKLAHLKPVQEIIRLLYFLTGASTERQAVLAYNTINRGLLDMDERAIAETLITPIKRQEPGHFAFYRMSATAMIQQGVLRPWQLFLARVLRGVSFAPVGANTKEQWADYGGVVRALGMDRDHEAYAAEVGRVEAQLLWAHKRGMTVPPYVLKALRESIELFDAREQRMGVEPR
ncbi:GTP-binding protein LepA [Nocardiopsis oceani]